MTDEPKGITLTDLDEEVCLQKGTPKVESSGKLVKLTRRIAIVHALESHSDTKKGDKFKAFDLGMRFQSANGDIAIDIDEASMLKLAIESGWPQPGVFVPLCRWLEGA